MKVAHIYASNCKSNSGDFLIGIAYKKYFKEVILKTNEEIKYTDFDCREKKNYDDYNISKLNNFDYIILGGGGLILPDTNSNDISCWQWIISYKNINKINKPIYVLSIGFNLFYNQNMNMNDRNSNKENKERLPIFKENIITLIKKAEIFTLRHNDDVIKLKNIIRDNKQYDFIDKIKYEMCATVWYAINYMKPKMQLVNKKYHAIEIKDDREWRRYYKIGKINFYNKLIVLINKLKEKNIPVLYLSHDGSNNFYKFLQNKNINLPFLNNSCANENKIIENYSKISTIYCTAGHSQMISYGLDIKIISLITHPKLKNFCDDIDDKNYIDINHNIDKLFLNVI